MSDKPSSQEILVHDADWTLLLPLSIDEFDVIGMENEPNRLQRWINKITAVDDHGPNPLYGHWTEKTDEYPRDLPKADDPDAMAEYAEFVYFHPFVRNFLYVNRHDEFDAANAKKTTADSKSMRTLERTRLEESTLVVDVFLYPKTYRVRLLIRKCQLFLFDTNVAIFALKLSLTDPANPDRQCVQELDDSGQVVAESPSSGPLNLELAIQLQDVLRRLYSPYFRLDDGHVYVARSPERIEIESKTVGTGEMNSPAELQDQIHADREAPLYQFWQDLLKPLKPNEIIRDEGTGRVKRPQEVNALHGGEAGLRYRQILDDRMPLMSYLIVDRVWDISDADWMRLAMIDDAGHSGRLPYSPDFKTYEDACKEYFYDRFYVHNPQQENANAKYGGLRWYTCGYGFGAVANRLEYDEQGNPEHDQETGEIQQSDFNTSTLDGSRTHFRHHYYKMALVVYFQHASLLNFKREVAEATRWLRLDSSYAEEKVEFRLFRERVIELEKEFLRFRSQYWSSEISNQVQAKELFDKWSAHLQTDSLFQMVRDELYSASEILERHFEARQAVWGKRLAIIAAAFLILQPVIAESSGGNYAKVAYLLFCGGFVFGLVWLAAQWVAERGYEKKQNTLMGPERFQRRIGRLIRWRRAGIVGFVLGAILCWWLWSGAAKQGAERSKPIVKSPVSVDDDVAGQARSPAK